MRSVRAGFTRTDRGVSGFGPLTSGTYLPVNSALLNQVSGWLPVRPFNEALTGLFARHAGADWRELAVLAAWGAVGAVVAVRRFRWDPRPE
ncbi:MAG TPA: hypothetical protein VFQ68_36290 [Streptosporangiaceae bacterium]|nr:hypothetical protein [Streptosporangiaceae bacterium]